MASKKCHKKIFPSDNYAIVNYAKKLAQNKIVNISIILKNRFKN